jgi:hypothetical protein
VTAPGSSKLGSVINLGQNAGLGVFDHPLSTRGDWIRSYYDRRLEELKTAARSFVFSVLASTARQRTNGINRFEHTTTARQRDREVDVVVVAGGDEDSCRQRPSYLV